MDEEKQEKGDSESDAKATNRSTFLRECREALREPLSRNETTSILLKLMSSADADSSNIVLEWIRSNPTSPIAEMFLIMAIQDGFDCIAEVRQWCEENIEHEGVGQVMEIAAVLSHEPRPVYEWLNEWTKRHKGHITAIHALTLLLEEHSETALFDRVGLEKLATQWLMEDGPRYVERSESGTATVSRLVSGLLSSPNISADTVDSVRSWVDSNPACKLSELTERKLKTRSSQS